MKKYISCFFILIFVFSSAVKSATPAKGANKTTTSTTMPNPPAPEIMDETEKDLDSEISTAEETKEDEFIKNEDLGENELLYNDKPDVETAKPGESPKVEVKGNDENRDQNFADQEEKQTADLINAETAQKIRAKQRLKEIDKNEHLQVVPYYQGAKAPKLQKKLRDGSRIYTTKPSPQHYSGGFRVGPFAPTSLQGDRAGVSFSNVYGNAKPITLNIDFEWQFFQKAGKLGLQTGLGFFTASGNGRFISNGNQADEVFNLYVFPMNATLMYRAQFYDKQPIAPFGGVGVDYFGMMESRDDKTNIAQKLKFGGGAAWHWTAGVQFQLDGLDREVIWQIDQDYGINHIYLIADARQIFGLSSTYDFSALYYEGGFLFEF